MTVKSARRTVPNECCARSETAHQVAPGAVRPAIRRVPPYPGSTSGHERNVDVLTAYNADVLPGYLEHPERIDALATRADVVALTVEVIWSITAPLGSNFDCLLPGHEGHASLFRDPQSNTWKLRCWCRDKWWRLAEVRASLGYGKPTRLKNPESAIWYRRLWHDATLIPPAPVVLPSLPDNATPATRRVAAGFRLLAGLRWLTHSHLPVPYTRTFAAAWCGVGEATAGKAITTALEHGTIRQVGERPVAGTASDCSSLALAKHRGWRTS